MEKKAVIFDLDGTLLDTSEGIIESAVYMLHTCGLPNLSLDCLRKFVGPPIQESLQFYFGLSEQDSQKCAEVFRDYYKEKALMKASLYDGIHKLLTKLRDSGFLIGVATYKREDYALSILKSFGILSYCNTAHGADNFNKLTKSDIILKCIDELNLDISSVVLVGDTDHDALGALKAHVDFIAVTWGFGYTSREDCTNYPNIGRIDSPMDLYNLLCSKI